MKERILIVEDEAIVALDIKTILSGLGYEVLDPISSGEKAIFEIGNINPDLVLMDIQLSGEIDGLDAAVEIHRNYQIPVIYLTAYSDEHLFQEIKKTHPYGYLIKPFNEHQLAVAVDVALEIYRVEKELKFNQARLSKMMSIAGLGYWEWDEKKAIIKFSENMSEMIGLGDGELVIGVDEMREIIHPEDRKHVRETIISYQDNFLQTAHISFRMITDSGDYKTFEATPIAMETAADEPDSRVMVGALYDVTDRLQMKKSQVEREAILSTVNGINQAALRSQTLDEVNTALLKVLSDYYRNYRSCFLLHDDINYTWKWVCPEDAKMENFQDLIQNEVEFSEFLERNKPELIQIHQKNLIGRELDDALELACWIFPLISGEKQLGIWFLVSEEDDILTEKIGKVGKDIADQVALAIAKTKLLEDLHLQFAETEIIREAGTKLLQVRDQGKAVSVILETINQIIQPEYAVLFLPSGDRLVPEGFEGNKNPDWIRELQISISSLTNLQKLDNEQFLILDQYLIRELFGKKKIGEKNTKWMLLPLVAGNELTGIIMVASGKEGFLSYPELQGRLQVFANQAAVALQNAQLSESTRNQVYITKTLQRVSSLLASGLGLDEVLSTILQLLDRVVEYDQAFIAMLNDENVLELAASRPQVERGIYAEFFEKNTDTIKNRFRGQIDEPIVFGEVSKVKNWVELKNQHKIQSTIHAPLTDRGKVFGFLFVDSDKSGFYNQETGQTVMAFANQASLAISNIRLFERVQKLALTDELTGVYNRRYLLRIGERELKRAERFNENLALIILDFDHFKQINDSYGHSIGDEVIQSVVERICYVVRDIDTVARYGGDEFVILLAKADRLIAEQVAIRLDKEINQKSLNTSQGKLKVTISMGAVELSPEHSTLELMLKVADEALYLAKRDGRSCFRIL